MLVGEGQFLRQSKRYNYYRGLRSEVDYKSKGSTVAKKANKFAPKGHGRAKSRPEGRRTSRANLNTYLGTAI